MEDELLEEGVKKYDRLTIQQMIERAGNSDTYQWRMFLIFFFCWFSAAFIQMGFPIIFQPAQFECQGDQCNEQYACQNNLPLSDSVKSVAYQFNLTCDRKGFLKICFNAFLYGGFIGSLYYGQIIQRKGRKHAAIQSIIMMVSGLYLSLISGNITLFSIGVFFFNAGFRGFYNASLLCLVEVMNEVSRTATPMVLSIGWALGQIVIAIIGVFILSWRFIFFVTAVPLTVLLWYTYKFTKQSPRFLVVKHEFQKARTVVQEIALVNGNRYDKCQLVQEISYKEKMRAYHEIMGEGQIKSTLKHHSYLSLLKYNSIRIRVIIVGLIWSLFSLSYFISANSFINPDRSIPFNIALAGVVQIIAYMVSILTSLNYSRIFFIKRLLITAGIIHILYFFIEPLTNYHGLSKVIVIAFDISVRVTMSVGNTFLAIYALQLFPTSIRHFSLGILGFITKLMYMLSNYFKQFWVNREIHPNFVIGGLFFGSFFMVSKLRQTHRRNFKDNLSQDGDGTMMHQMHVNII